VDPPAIHGSDLEYHAYCADRHFMSVIITNYALGGPYSVDVRYHPGVDINAFGISHHFASFIADGDVQDAVLPVVTVTSDVAGVTLTAGGRVNRAGGSYGSWNARVVYTYDRAGKRVNGSGPYNVMLPDRLSSASGDLNLGRLASNYLTGVPLQCGGTGDTGDTASVHVSGPGYDLPTWLPPSTAGRGHCPTESAASIIIEAQGCCNDVDAGALGLPPLVSASKPSLRLTFASGSGVPIGFCGFYGTGCGSSRCVMPLICTRCPYDDNLTMHAVVRRGDPVAGFVTIFPFTLTVESTALPGDGSMSCCH